MAPIPPSDGLAAQSYHASELRHRVDTAINTNPHLSGHHVFCQTESGIVVLHGRVSSFFQKQMAQEALKRLEGVEKIINELEVDWRRDASQR
ncbi:MAG: BON domain-containing protein [Pirellulaceae bacterium]